VIAELSANHAHHCRRRERQDVCVVVHNVTVDGVDSSHAGSLDEIVDRFAAGLVASRNVIGDRQTPLDYGVALTP
jgi:hypothetical protein